MQNSIIRAMPREIDAMFLISGPKHEFDVLADTVCSDFRYVRQNKEHAVEMGQKWAKHGNY